MHSFMQQAEQLAQRSLDPSSKTSCVLVDQHGAYIAGCCNRFVIGDPEDTTEVWNDHSNKYDHVVHAEVLAVATAARGCQSTLYGCAYLPWYPCLNCAKTLLAAGIIRVVCHCPDWDHSRWGDDFKKVRALFERMNTKVLFAEPQGENK